MNVLAFHLGVRDAPGVTEATAKLTLLSTSEDAVITVSSVLEGPVVLLGARQRVRRVLDLSQCSLGGVAVLRRATTGVAAFIAERALWWTLVLPRIDALYADATAATLLNRNVRGYLRGLSRCGAAAHYLGRDAIVFERQPVALLGYDVDESGAVRMDVIAGWEMGFELPEALRSDDERQLAPRLSRPAIALGPLCRGRTPDEVARLVALSAVERGAEPPVVRVDEGPIPEVAPRPPGPDDPAPDEVLGWGERRVPMGRVEAGVGPGVVWLGGDALVSTEWLRRAERALCSGGEIPGQEVLHGALPEDYWAAWKSAVGRGPGA